MQAFSRPVKRLSGTVTAPGDKSCSHRALMLSAMAPGNSEIKGLLCSGDVLATAQALRQFGAKIEQIDPDRWIITGTRSFITPQAALDMGNSGTGARLMMGIAAGRRIACVFIGDTSLSKRPMQRVLEPLGLMGAEYEYESNSGCLPVRLLAGDSLHGIEYVLPKPSAQLKSALLLAGLEAKGRTRITEPQPSRDHTENMLPAFGVALERGQQDDPRWLSPADMSSIAALGQDDQSWVALCGGQTLSPAKLEIPGDPSSAAFLWAATLIAAKAETIISNVMLSPHRDGLQRVAERMGADLQISPAGSACGEQYAHITARSGMLKAVSPPPELAPAMIDEYPLFGVLAAFASGDSHVRGASELRLKESDRISATVAMLQANGVEAEASSDGFYVRGVGGPPPGGGLVHSHGDHRIAMSALVLGSAAKSPVIVDDVSSVATSYPGFFADMRRIGADIELGSAA